MRVLHIIFSFGIGGAETMLVDILNRQIMTYDVGLCIINNIYSVELLKQINSNVKIIHIYRKKGSKNILDILKLNYKIVQFKPDIIHSHESNISNYIFLRHSAKLLLTVHDNQLNLVNLNNYDEIFSISKSVQNELITKYKNKSMLLYNGIDINTIKKKSANILNTSGVFKIVQVGRLEHLKKGQHLLIESIHLLVTMYKFKNATVDFIGDGDSLSYLKNLANSYHIDNHINFLGNKTRSYIYSRLCNYDLLVQPSLIEGFGLTVIEAMAANVPVLVSNSGGPYEIIGDDEYGFSFKSNDVADLAKKLHEIILNPERIGVAQNAKFHVERNFDINQTVDNYNTRYRELISK